MAANVETMFYTRTKPWHGLGTMVEEAATSGAALELAGLDWRVVQKNLVTEEGITVPGFRANLRETDNQVLGSFAKIQVRRPFCKLPAVSYVTPSPSNSSVKANASSFWTTL